MYLSNFQKLTNNYVIALLFVLLLKLARYPFYNINKNVLITCSIEFVLSFSQTMLSRFATPSAEQKEELI